jgi:hypothetical protein
MNEIFQEIMELDHVTGGLFISKEGKVVYSQFLTQAMVPFENHNWLSLINALGNISEADILYENARLFLRKTNAGYLLILTEPYAILSLIKLQCDLLIQKLNEYKPNKSVSRFFKK